MNKTHKNCVDFHRDKLEAKFNYKCKKEFDIARDGKLHKLDLACFENNPKPPIGMEFESSWNFDNPQIKSNAEDLKEFKRLYPIAKTFHIHVSQEIDFDKELNQPSQQPQLQPQLKPQFNKPVIVRKPMWRVR